MMHGLVARMQAKISAYWVDNLRQSVSISGWICSPTPLSCFARIFHKSFDT